MSRKTYNRRWGNYTQGTKKRSFQAGKRKEAPHTQTANTPQRTQRRPQVHYSIRRQTLQEEKELTNNDEL